MIELSSFITLIKCFTRKQKQEKECIHQNPVLPTGIYRFSKAEIKKAIDQGLGVRWVGRRRIGQVFKGMLPSGQLVTIKQIYKRDNSVPFTTEINGLSRIRHPNIACLLGYSIEDGEQYLVYEYCSNGNLAQHLGKNSALTWEMRVKIMRDCAFALKYLHHHFDGCIVHRNIKLENILLNDNMEPKLSSFTLARMLELEETKVTKDIPIYGNIDYMELEYMINSKPTCANDVHRFGIVMLQLLSGRGRALDLDAGDQLIRKAKDVNMGKRPLTDFQDPRMDGKVITADFESILQLAVECVASSSTGCPTIDSVYEELEKAWKNTHGL